MEPWITHALPPYGVDRDSGGESGHGARAGRDIETKCLSRLLSRARRSDPSPLSRSIPSDGMFKLMTVGTTFPRKILNNGKEPCEPLMTTVMLCTAPIVPLKIIYKENWRGCKLYSLESLTRKEIYRHRGGIGISVMNRDMGLKMSLKRGGPPVEGRFYPICPDWLLVSRSTPVEGTALKRGSVTYPFFWCMYYYPLFAKWWNSLLSWKALSDSPSVIYQFYRNYLTEMCINFSQCLF